MELPDGDSLSEVLSGLLARQVTLRPSSSQIGKAKGAPVVVAELNTADGELFALLAVDVAFACLSGGAIAMLPIGRVADAAKAKSVPDELLENYHEVANVITASFRPSGMRVLLGSIFTNDDLPAELGDKLKQSDGRTDWDVEISGYGAAKATLIGPSA